MSANTRLSQIEHSTLSLYGKYDVATKKRDEAQGRKDGEQNFPSPTDSVHHFHEEVLGQARASLKTYAARLSTYHHELRAREHTLTKRIEEGLATERDQLNDRYQEQQDAIERRVGPSSPNHSSIRLAYEQARDRAQEIETQLGRPLRIHLRWFYLPIMALVAISEVPINRFAFELYFSESPIISLGISLVLGIIFAFFAHFLGTWLKRSMHHPTWRGRIGAYLGSALVVLIIAPTIFVIALMRDHYVQFIEQTSRSLRDIIQSESLTSVAREVVSTDLSTAGWTLLLLNVIIFSVGSICAFARHDSHPDFENVIRQRNRMAKKRRKIEHRYEEVTAKVRKEYETKKDSLDKSQRLAMDELEVVRHQLAETQGHPAAVVERISSFLFQRLNAYEYANRRARKDKETPRCFGASEKDLVSALSGTVEELGDLESASGGDVHRIA